MSNDKQNQTQPGSPVQRLVGRFRKGDGEYIRSICDFSSGVHVRKIRRIALAIDKSQETICEAIELLKNSKENFSIVDEYDWKKLIAIEDFIVKHAQPNAEDQRAGPPAG
jgi:hypothetical protein